MKTLRYRLGPALAAVAILTLTACSNDAEPPNADPSASVTSEDPSTHPSDEPRADPSDNPAKVPDISVDPDTGELDFCDQQTTPFTGSAPEEFGQEKVKQAYCDMVALQYQYGFVHSLWSRPFDGEFRAIEFSQIRPHLTTDAREVWDEKVEKFVNEGDEKSAADMYGLMGFGAQGARGFTFAEATEEPLYYNLKISPARTGVDREESEPRLLLTFTVTLDLNMIKNGERVFLPFEKEITYYLLDNGDHPDIPWLIDTWKHITDVGEVRPYDPPVAEN